MARGELKLIQTIEKLVLQKSMKAAGRPESVSSSGVANHSLETEFTTIV